MGCTRCDRLQLGIERKLAYELVNHSFPEAIAGALFEFFQSIADQPTRLDDFQFSRAVSNCSSSRSLKNRQDTDRDTCNMTSEEDSQSRMNASRSGSVFGDYFSAFAGRKHPFAVIMFGDLVEFTALASSTGPVKLVQYLDSLFGQFDEMCLHHCVEKIKTIGDCYMCVGWPANHFSHKETAKSCVSFATDMHAICAQCPLDDNELQMRVGLHCGPVVGGIIGKTKFCYDIWGDTVNVASRMETTGQPGKTHVSSELYSLLKDDVPFTPRGLVDVKGKGKLQTYFVAEAPGSPKKLQRCATTDLTDFQAKLPEGICELFDSLQGSHNAVGGGFGDDSPHAGLKTTAARRAALAPVVPDAADLPNTPIPFGGPDKAHVRSPKIRKSLSNIHNVHMPNRTKTNTWTKAGSKAGSPKAGSHASPVPPSSNSSLLFLPFESSDVASSSTTALVHSPTAGARTGHAENGVSRA